MSRSSWLTMFLAVVLLVIFVCIFGRPAPFVSSKGENYESDSIPAMSETTTQESNPVFTSEAQVVLGQIVSDTTVPEVNQVYVVEVVSTPQGTFETAPTDQSANLVTVEDTPTPTLPVVYVQPSLTPVDMSGPQPFFTYEPTFENATPFTLDMLDQATLQPASTLVVSVPQHSLLDLLDMDLDQLWDFVEEGGLVGIVEPCVGQPESPYVTWAMAYTAAYSQTLDRDYEEVKISSSEASLILSQTGISFPNYGTVQIPEETVKSKLRETIFQGNLRVCLVGIHPVIYGTGIYDFLNWAAGYIY